MSVDAGGAAPGVPVDALLLDAKVSIPETRPGSVSRAELIVAARASERRVVGVTAPAGYGKSTLLVEWARTDDRPVAWVSLDRLDDDPAALLSLLASAYARVDPGNADVIADMGGTGRSLLGRAAPRLASVFRTRPDPFILMLDDLHELESPACHDVLSVVMSGIPAGSQLVAASRSEQPHLARLRASGDALELRADDLALDAAGAEQIFSAADIELTSEGAAELTARTEGWPAGLYLASLIAKEADGDPLAISGDDRWVADYLYRESFQRLPAEMQDFLRYTAVLDQMCAPLCDAVLGQTGTRDQLRELEASSLFLIPLDRRREWYRYHALFREFLLGELRRAEPGVVAKLHICAADWYEANGSPTLAVEHLLNTNERNRCVQLVTELILPTYNAGNMSAVQRWLAALDDADIADYPPLAVLAGWVAALSGQTVEAERWAAQVDAASFDMVPLDGSASFDSARAMLRGMMCPAGPQQALADASFAVTQEPSWSPWRDTALAVLAYAHLLDGDRDATRRRFAEASLAGAAAGNTDTIVGSEAELALLAMDDGEWERAAEHLEMALEVIEEHRLDDYVLCLVAFAAAARLAVHRGALEDANRQLTRAMRARPSSTFVLPHLAVALRLHLAKTYFAIGDQATARHLLREIDDIVIRRPSLGVLIDEVAALRDVMTSSTEVAAAGQSPLTPAELRLLPYLQTHLNFREVGERLFVSRNTVSSQVGAIYRKLGVSSRSEAVEQATKVGLLGG